MKLKGSLKEELYQEEKREIIPVQISAKKGENCFKSNILLNIILY